MRDQLYQYLLTLNRSRILDKLISQVLFLFLKITGKNIGYKFANWKLCLPISHSLPWNIAKHPLYSYNFGDIIKAANLSVNDIVIDIGANVGDTAALVRNVSEAQVICVEGDPIYFEYLQKNTIPMNGVKLYKKFVGEQSIQSNNSLRIENGTARLVADASNSLELVALDDLIVNTSDKEKIAVIKIDTDGFDNKIIRGAKKLINKYHPIIFFEYDPFFLENNQEKGIDIFELLGSWGYQKFVFYDNFGEKICSCNTNQMDVIRDLHEYYSGKAGTRYMDVAAYTS